MSGDLISYVFPKNINETSCKDLADKGDLFKSNNKYLSEYGDILDYKCPLNLRLDSIERVNCFTQKYQHNESTFKLYKDHPGKWKNPITLKYLCLYSLTY